MNVALADRIAAERPRLVRYAMALLRHRENAEDLAQTVMVKALLNLHRFEEGTDLAAWLITMMRRRWIDYARREALENTITVDPHSPFWRKTPAANDEQFQRVQFKEAIGLIKKMPLATGRVLIMVGFWGEGIERVAKIEGVPISTVKSRLYRGRDQLLANMDNERLAA